VATTVLCEVGHLFVAVQVADSIFATIVASFIKTLRLFYEGDQFREFNGSNNERVEIF
jgi:hypothetical protein